MEDVITLYPSNWLYNAGVIGFLKVVASFKGEKAVEKWLNNDGTVTLNLKELEFLEETYKPNSKKPLSGPIGELNNWAGRYIELSSKIGKHSREREFEAIFIETTKELFDRRSLYTNLIPLDTDLSESVRALNYKLRWLWYKRYNDQNQQNGKDLFYLRCSFCNDPFPSTIKLLPKPMKYSYFSFQNKFSSLLGGSRTGFPNCFWNNEPNMYICPLCDFFLIHHHIPFQKLKTEKRNASEKTKVSEEIFINAPSFIVMWHLNKFAERLLDEFDKQEPGKILGISLIEFAQKVHITLGAWSIMNIEVIIKKDIEKDKKKESKIEYYSIPYYIANALLQRDIANLIRSSEETIVLEKILEGDFEFLLKLSYKIMKTLLTHEDPLKNKDELVDPLPELENKSSKRLLKLSRILPELYVKMYLNTQSEVGE